MKKKCSLYILKSEVTDKLYIGITNNLKRRFYEHNSGQSRSTKSYAPWILVFQMVFSSKAEAMSRKKKLKNLKSRKKIENWVSTNGGWII